MTLTVRAAFERLRERLEITREDEQLALRRRGDIVERLAKDLDILPDIVRSGSFHRDTKTRPLKDVDLMVLLRDTRENRERYFEKHPSVVLDAYASSLAKRYGDQVKPRRRSVRVWFGPEAEPILSYDVVPAFARFDGAFDIPDSTAATTWIATDPRVHARLATEANTGCDGKWKPLVKMVKGWNQRIGDNEGEKAVRPSFLIEVMALEAILPPVGDYADEMQMLFANLAQRVMQDWKDPAGLGPGVNEMDSRQREIARDALQAAHQVAHEARYLARTSQRQAILKWRELFGELMPLED